MLSEATDTVLYFVSRNLNKVSEIGRLLEGIVEIKGLNDLDFNEDIPEPYDTFQKNAHNKAYTIFSRFNVDCFADDSGLEVEALEGAPGVRSARYAGKQGDDAANNELLLRNMAHQQNRKAQFRTVISLFLNGREYQFEGVVKGKLTESPRGTQGFGYDPIFIPEQYRKTFAEMSLEEKNKISHRARAVSKLVDFLKDKTSA